MARSQLCVVLIASALLLSHIADGRASGPSLSAMIRDKHSSSSNQRVSTAQASSSSSSTSSDNDYYESKTVCLQEFRQHDCRWLGCTNGGDCQTGDFGTSDFTCCADDYYGYKYGDDAPNHNLFLPQNTVGSCDWSTFYFHGATSNGVSIVNGLTEKIGMAFATCYFNSESEFCGWPLCDRMVLSLQGMVYRTKAYSHQPPATINRDDDCTTATGPPAAPAAAAAFGTRRILNVDSASTAEQAKPHYNSYGHDENTIYYGDAIVITGTVTAAAGQKHDAHCVEGLFEYVPYFNGTENTAGVDPTVPWVKGNTYKMEFSQSKSY